MFIFTNKTNNTYEIYCKDHEILNENRINKTYKKGPTELEKLINLDVKNIAKNINYADRVEYFPRVESFITLKDHKDNLTTLQRPSLELVSNK